MNTFPTGCGRSWRPGQLVDYRAIRRPGVCAVPFVDCARLRSGCRRRQHRWGWVAVRRDESTTSIRASWAMLFIRVNVMLLRALAFLCLAIVHN